MTESYNWNWNPSRVADRKVCVKDMGKSVLADCISQIYTDHCQLIRMLFIHSVPSSYFEDCDKSNIFKLRSQESCLYQNSW